MPSFPLVCATCGATAELASPRAVYCSARCRSAAFDRRRRAAAELGARQTHALLRGDTHTALQLARRAITGE